MYKQCKSRSAIQSNFFSQTFTSTRQRGAFVLTILEAVIYNILLMTKWVSYFVYTDLWIKHFYLLRLLAAVVLLRGAVLPEPMLNIPPPIKNNMLR